MDVCVADDTEDNSVSHYGVALVDALDDSWRQLDCGPIQA
jgi:hypothetical protein